MTKDTNLTAPDPKALAETSKASAEARTAKAEALKAERELLEAESPLGKAKQEAEVQKTIAEAQQQAAEAQQKQLSALLPDLSKVTPGGLEAKGDQALFSAALAQRSTAAAATLIAKLVGEAISESAASARILITSDIELASSDAIYVEVTTGLDQLNTAAENLVKDVKPPAPKMAGFSASFAIAPFVSAVSAALPGALSLVSAHRSLSTSPTTVDSLAAAAVVAGELSQRHPAPAAVIHDDIRLLPKDGALQTALADLAEHRQALIGRKLALEDEKASGNANLTELKGKVNDLSEERDKATGKERETLQLALDRQREEAADCERKVNESSVRIGLIDSTTAAIDKFTASLQARAEGATRSPLAAAVLHEQLHHPADDGGFTHLLLVKAEPGSAQQLIDDRPLLFKDKFATIATSSVTYVLIETTGSKIIRAGSVGGEAKITGSIGKDFSVSASADATDA